jgi:hypothetical protein
VIGWSPPPSIPRATSGNMWALHPSNSIMNLNQEGYPKRPLLLLLSYCWVSFKTFWKSCGELALGRPLSQLWSHHWCFWIDTKIFFLQSNLTENLLIWDGSKKYLQPQQKNNTQHPTPRKHNNNNPRCIPRYANL